MGTMFLHEYLDISLILLQNLEDINLMLLSGPKYVLLGHEAKTVLAVVASREKYGEMLKGVLAKKETGVTIYTSAMLDYM